MFLFQFNVQVKRAELRSEKWQMGLDQFLYNSNSKQKHVILQSWLMPVTKTAPQMLGIALGYAWRKGI